MAIARAVTNETGYHLVRGLDVHGGIKPVEASDSIAAIWSIAVHCNEIGKLGDLLDDVNLSLLANHIHRSGYPLTTPVEFRRRYKKAKHIRDVSVIGVGTYRESRGRIVFRK